MAAVLGWGHTSSVPKKGCKCPYLIFLLCANGPEPEPVDHTPADAPEPARDGGSVSDDNLALLKTY